MRKGSNAILSLMLLAALWGLLWPSEPTGTQRADPGTALFVGAVVIAWVAGMLLKPKTPPQQRDTRAPTLVSRGDQIPYVIGRRVTQGMPFWVGRRTSREESVGGGGKKGFGGGKKAKQIVYYEDAVHVVRLGPGSALFKILSNQKPIFTGPISPDTTPSGSVLQDIEGNSFAIYWGELGQPVNASLALDDALGIPSNWPYHFYIHWIQFRCGTSAVWPQLDYDAASDCVGTTLPGSECYIPELAPDAGNGGVNGAHAMYQLCTGSFPHGAGMDPASFNFGWWSKLGALLESEQFPQNILISSQTTLAAIIDDILTDARVLLVQNGHDLVFMPIRTPENVPTLTDVVLVLPEPEYEIDHSGSAPDAIVFIYPDLMENFRDTDLPIDDDGIALTTRRRNSSQKQLPTITNQASAAAAAEQIKLITAADANSITLKLNRTARRVVVGQSAILPEIGLIRFTSTKPESINGYVTVTASVDQFSLAGSGWSPTADNTGIGTNAKTQDDALIVMEVPFDFVGDVLAVAAIRVRMNGTGINAAVWVSTNGSTYKNIGDQLTSAAGATLLEPLSEDSYTIIENGPLVQATAASMSKVHDLSGDEAGWKTGRQLCLIGGEICYLRNVSAEVGGYRLHGLIRGRAGSWPLGHAIGSLVAIIESENINFFEDKSWAPSMTVYAKAQPEGLPLDGAPLGAVKLTGKALGPYPVDNLMPLFRDAGEDAVLTWTERIRAGTGCGAGEGPAGEAQASEPPSEIDSFRVRVLGVDDYLIREDTVTSPGWTYAYSDMLSDAVGDLDFTIEITAIKGSYGGYSRRWIVKGTDT